MNRPRRKKELSLMEELKERNLIEDGDPVDIPDLANEDLLEENSSSVIVRCLNPTVHKVGGLIKALPSIWGLEERVRGRGIGGDRVQFLFSCERDLQYVLTKGPWFVNEWIVAVDKWVPFPGPDFLNRIPFWIRIKGIPIHFWKDESVRAVVEPLGFVEKVELHAKNSSSLEYARALVHIKADEPLQFRKLARFRTGESSMTELTYEKLLKICFLCKRLTHDQTKCPFQVQPEQSAKKGGKRTPRSEAFNAAKKGKGLAQEEGVVNKSGLNERLVFPKANQAVSKKGKGRSVKERLQWVRKEPEYEIERGLQSRYSSSKEDLSVGEEDSTKGGGSRAGGCTSKSSGESGIMGSRKRRLSGS